MTDNAIGRGTVLAGRFRLEDLVNEHEGARFWRATDQILARNVAVHVIPAEDQRADALLTAARTSATVTDGHFLRVLDAAREDGVTYVVHEWGTGVSLDKLLTDGPLPARRAAWLVKEVAEAITTAHRQGIAHGRLVPENVMVTEAGAVKLIGFVVDAVLHGRPEADDDGRPLSEHESDVRNLAALLYVTLVGKWPGTEGSVVAAAPRDHGRMMRPRQVKAGVPRPLDTICDRVLSPEPAHHQPRIETAHEICAALSDFIGDPAGIAPPGFEPTSVIDRDELLGLTDPGLPAAASQSGPPTTDAASDASPDTAAGTPAGAAPADPEATQAGAPVFFDDDTGVGWVGQGSGRGRPAPPPPPPLPEPEERPLFAPGPPRSQMPTPSSPGTWTGQRFGDVTGSQPSSSSHGTGSLPAVWGPDADTPDEPSHRAEDAGKNWLRLAGLVAGALVLVFAVVIAFNLGRAGTGGSAGEDPSESPTQQAPSGPVTIAGVSDFDPQGDPPEENPELAPLAADGDPSTAWRTMTYYNNPKLGLLKDGVGLVVDLGGPTEVSEVQLTLVGQPTSLEVYAAPQGQGPPSSVDGLDKVASAEGAGPKVNLSLDQPVTTGHLVVWLTSLPATSGGYAGQVAEIVVRR